MQQQLKPFIPPLLRRRVGLAPRGFAAESPLGPRRPIVDFKPFTTAQMDTKLFGEHTGIKLPGPIVFAPMPNKITKDKPRDLTQKANPWYMAPGWNAGRRKITLRRWDAIQGQPRLGTNPWDSKYGIIGTPPSNLEVIRVNQMGTMSFV